MTPSQFGSQKSTPSSGRRRSSCNIPKKWDGPPSSESPPTKKTTMSAHQINSALLLGSLGLIGLGVSLDRLQEVDWLAAANKQLRYCGKAPGDSQLEVF